MALTNYTNYMENQILKTNWQMSKGVAQWVFEPEIAKVASYVREHLPLKHRFALCHGARSGREVEWFRSHLPEVRMTHGHASHRYSHSTQSTHELQRKKHKHVHAGPDLGHRAITISGGECRMDAAARLQRGDALEMSHVHVYRTHAHTHAHACPPADVHALAHPHAQ